MAIEISIDELNEVLCGASLEAAFIAAREFGFSGIRVVKRDGKYTRLPPEKDVDVLSLEVRDGLVVNVVGIG